MVGKDCHLLSDDIRNTLKAAACDLIDRVVEGTRISTDVCEAYVETKGKRVLVGTRAGILFKSQVSTHDGQYQVNFLLSEEDLERGARLLRRRYEEEKLVGGLGLGRIPCEELYEFDDLSSLTIN